MDAPVEWHPKMFTGLKNQLVSQVAPPCHVVVLWHAQKGFCYLCGKKMSGRRTGSPQYRSLDHVLPRALGGRTDFLNKALACKRCNTLRQTRPLTPAQQVRLYHVYRAVGRVIADIGKGKTLELAEFRCPPPWP